MRWQNVIHPMRLARGIEHLHARNGGAHRNGWPDSRCFALETPPTLAVAPRLAFLGGSIPWTHVQGYSIPLLRN